MTGLFLAAWRLVVKRASHDRLILAAAFVTVLLATTLLAAGPIYGEAVALSGLRRTLEDARAPDRALEIAARLGAEERASAAARVANSVDGTFGPAGAEIYESGRSDSFAFPRRGGFPAEALAVLAFFDRLDRHARLVAGAWPGPGPRDSVAAALSEPAAEALGLAAGDVFTLTSTQDASRAVSIRVSGVYRIRDPADPFWWEDRLETEGRERVSFTTFGPLVVREQDFAEITEAGAEIRWRVEPRIDRLTVDDLPALRERLADLDERLNDGRAATGRFSVDTGLSDVLRTTERTLVVTRSGVLIPAVQLGVLAGAALLFLAGLLSDRRSLEGVLMRSRGAGSGELGLLALMEGLVLALPAAAAAPWLAAFSLSVLNHVGPLAEIDLELEPRVSAQSYLLALAAAAACVGALALPALRSAPVLSAVRERGRPREKGLIQRTGLDLLLVALAVLAYWQLRRYRGTLLETLQGRLGVDPFLVAAPALGLLAGAVLALRMLPASASLLERAVVRARGLVAPLGARELSRRPDRYARSALLLTLALAIGLFASAYARTWLRSQEDQADYRAGADVRVLPSARSGSIPPMAQGSAYAALEGVRGALPVVRRSLAVESASGSANLLALDASRAAGLVRFRPDLADRPVRDLLAVLAARRPKIASFPLPGRPSRLALDLHLAVRPRAGDPPREFVLDAVQPTVAVVLRDGNGLLYRFAEPPARTRTPSKRVEFDLAERFTGPSRGLPTYPLGLVALELETRVPFGPSRRLTATALRVLANEAPDGPLAAVSAARPSRWTAKVAEIQDVERRPEVLGLRTPARGLFALEFRTGSVTSSFFGNAPVTFTITPGRNAAPGALPAVVTDEFLASAGASVGGRVSLGAGHAPLAPVAAVRGFPTLGPDAGGVVVDLPTYLAGLYAASGAIFAPGEWWIASAPGAGESVARRLAGPPFTSLEVVDRIGTARRLARDPVAVGISGALTLGFVAAAVLAVVCFAVSAAVTRAERATEFAVLRSLGLSRGQLSGWVAIESGLTVALALAAGTALGALLAWLVLPFVSLSAEGGRPFPGVRVLFPWRNGVWLELAILGALCLVAALQIRLLRRAPLAPALRMAEEP